VSRRRRTLVLVVALPGCGLFLGPNPQFMDSLADDGETDTDSDELATSDDDMCPPGTLDCDGDPGCESSVDDPGSCGGCDNNCELGGEPLECVDGQCVGTVVFTDLADTYVDTELASQNFGAETRLVIDSSRASFIALPDIGELPMAASLEHVLLHVTCTQAGTSVQVQRIETEWDELELTADNAPSGSQVLDDVPLLRGENVIDLVGMLPSWRSGTPKRSVELSAIGPNPQPVVCSSREGRSPPYWEIAISW